MPTAAESRYGLWQQLKPKCHHAPGSNKGHSDEPRLSGNRTLGQNLAHIWQPRLSASTWSLWVTVATDINLDPGCTRAMNMEMALTCPLGQEVTMAPGGSTGHSDRHGPCGSMALRHKHGHGWGPRPWAFLHGLKWKHEPQMST